MVLESFERLHPGSRRFVCLVDRHPGVESELPPGVEVLYAEDLALPGGRRFLFKYRPMELCCALKPIAAREILLRRGVSALVYLDCDILILNPFWADLEEAWRRHAVLASPHLVALDPRMSAEDCLRLHKLSCYNTGFFAIHASAEGKAFLDWWCDKVARYSLEDLAGGLYCDQKWMELAACFSPDVRGLTDPGFNVAYWNLHERTLGRDAAGRWQVNGQPLRFFHFSGFDPAQLSVYKACDTDLGHAMALLYRDALAAAGQARWSTLPYGWGTFSNGEGIREMHRDLILAEHPEFRDVADPFKLPEHPEKWARFRWAVDWHGVSVRSADRLEHLETEIRQYHYVKEQIARIAQSRTAKTRSSRCDQNACSAWFDSFAIQPGSPRGSLAVVCDWIPYPPRSGDNRRTAEMIAYLRRDGWIVHLVLPTRPGPEIQARCLEHVDQLHCYGGTRWRRFRGRFLTYSSRTLRTLRIPKRKDVIAFFKGPAPQQVVKPRIEFPTFQPKFERYLGQLAAEHGWQAVIVNFAWLHPAIDRLPAGTLRVLDTIDILHRRVEEFVRRGEDPQVHMTRAQEAAIFRKFDAVIAIQHEEAALIREMCPERRVLTVGASLTPPSRPQVAEVPGCVLYVGGRNVPNVDGLRRFLEKGWPVVRAAIPRARLRVCGYVCEPFKTETFDGVDLLGYVQDAEVEYAQAEVVINPIWIGTGLKIKTVEGLARGKPVVTTPKGIEGMAGAAADVCALGADEAGVAQRIIELLDSPEQRAARSRAAFDYSDAHLSPQAVYRELMEFLEPVRGKL